MPHDYDWVFCSVWEYDLVFTPQRFTKLKDGTTILFKTKGRDYLCLLFKIRQDIKLKSYCYIAWQKYLASPKYDDLKYVNEILNVYDVSDI